MPKREVKEVVLSEDSTTKDVEPQEVDKKRRGRPKKEKVEKAKKPIGRPKSDTDIKTRRLLYGLTFFSKMLGLTDEEIEKKKEELLANIKSGKVDTNEYQHLTDNEQPIEKKGKDSDVELVV